MPPRIKQEFQNPRQGFRTSKPPKATGTAWHLKTQVLGLINTKKSPLRGAALMAARPAESWVHLTQNAYRQTFSQRFSYLWL